MKTWKQRLDVALDHEKFTNEDFDLANDYNCCAIGERRFDGIDIENRFSVNEILSWFIDRDKADKLAMEFYHAVWKDDVPKALDIYNQIQELQVRE